MTLLYPQYAPRTRIADYLFCGNAGSTENSISMDILFPWRSNSKILYTIIGLNPVQMINGHALRHGTDEGLGHQCVDTAPSDLTVYAEDRLQIAGHTVKVALHGARLPIRAALVASAAIRAQISHATNLIAGIFSDWFPNLVTHIWLQLYLGEGM